MTKVIYSKIVDRGVAPRLSSIHQELCQYSLSPNTLKIRNYLSE